MVPIDHSRLHARDFGGVPEDYLELDNFFDQTKLHCEDFRHRAILHSTLGIGLAEQIFGTTIRNSDGNDIPVRELARQHIRQDCGRVPTVKEWLDALSTGKAHQFNRPTRSDKQWLREHYYSQGDKAEHDRHERSGVEESHSGSA